MIDHRGKAAPGKITFILALIACVFVFVSMASAGGPGYAQPHQARLDPTITAFKDQGVWYFLCEAPIFNKRIPDHYATYGPPPPPYCCPPPHPGVPNAKPPQVVVAPH